MNWDDRGTPIKFNHATVGEGDVVEVSDKDDATKSKIVITVSDVKKGTSGAKWKQGDQQQDLADKG